VRWQRAEMMRAEQGHDSMTAGALQSTGALAHGIANEICVFREGL